MFSLLTKHYYYYSPKPGKRAEYGLKKRNCRIILLLARHFTYEDVLKEFRFFFGGAFLYYVIKTEGAEKAANRRGSRNRYTQQKKKKNDT